jgi:murein L,D-transpeptidase YafK
MLLAAGEADAADLSFIAAPPEPGFDCPARIADLPPVEGFDPADSRLTGDRVIVVLKSERRLMLYSNGEIRHDRDGWAPSCFPVALAPASTHSPKQRRGDLQTPVGWYRTSDKPWSSFENAIAIHYPNTSDADSGLARGRINTTQYAAIVDATRRGAVPPQDTSLGGQILIHGGGSEVDWTLGCIALDNPQLLELRAALPPGMRTQIAILP